MMLRRNKKQIETYIDEPILTIPNIVTTFSFSDDDTFRLDLLEILKHVRTLKGVIL